MNLTQDSFYFELLSLMPLMAPLLIINFILLTCFSRSCHVEREESKETSEIALIGELLAMYSVFKSLASVPAAKVDPFIPLKRETP